MSRSSRPGLAAALLLLLGLPGCVEHAIHQYFEPFDYEPLPVSSTPPPEPGAIYSGGTQGGSFLFFDRKARGVGDLVTVLIEEDIRAEGSATTDLSRGSEIDMSLSSDVGFADLVSTAFRKFFSLFLGNAGQATPAGQSVSAIQSSTTNDFAGEASTSRRGTFTAVITCRVVDVLPGRVFHIRGRRSLLVNHEEQFLTLEALVRPEDIGIDNTVPSAVLAEARLTMDGIGVVGDKQRPGWLARALDWVYPF